jgi:uncharacterized protein (DUF736 family)
MAWEKDPNEVGAVWKKTGAKGEYLSINFKGEWFVAFATKSKGQSGKGPDYRIMIQKPREQMPQTTTEDSDAPF